MSRTHYVTSRPLLAVVLAASWQSAAVTAAELGMRVSALHAETNLQGIGLIARWPLPQGFFAMASLDRQRYEQGNGTLPMPPATLQSVIVGAAFGREYQNASRLQSWFWSWGLSAGFPTTSRNEPATARLQFSAATEVHLTASLGISRQLSDSWTLSGAARLERHFVDWRLTDMDGTLLEREDSLSASGLSLALNYRF